ncbi:MAG TPA: alpha/beta hydrolase [Thermoanaerobaculia bacterium]|nr:alpha/beta hydrolase [Thermoanaerobaculia bacterium]
MKHTISLELRRVEEGRTTDGVEALRLHTTDGGMIDCRFHQARPGNAAVLWVGGAGGGLDGPAGGMYPRLAGKLVPEGIASLRLHYRRPNDLDACVLDTLLGVAYLGARGRPRVALAGHSFGGAVVITAGAESPEVVAVAALSSQTYGTGTVGVLSPRPLLLLHGSADEVLPDLCSRDLHRRAGQPKEIKLYPRCGHGLDECRDEVDRDLAGWLLRVLGRGLS